MLSITHRLTGLALYAGTAMMVWWLWVLAYNPASYQQMQECVSSWIGQLTLVGWTLAFYYHFSNGIRHLFWDIGMGYGLVQVTRSGWFTIVFALVMTAFTWKFILEAGQ